MDVWRKGGEMRVVMVVVMVVVLHVDCSSSRVRKGTWCCTRSLEHARTNSRGGTLANGQLKYLSCVWQNLSFLDHPHPSVPPPHLLLTLSLRCSSSDNYSLYSPAYTYTHTHAFHTPPASQPRDVSGYVCLATRNALVHLKSNV